MTINVDILDPASVQAAITQLESYDLEARVDEICRRLADIGFATASAGFAGAIYDGTNDVRVTVEPIDNGYAVKANGEAVLFIEYGAGATFGYGHPRPEGYGPGTYNPRSRRWSSPYGWYYGTSRDLHHTYGNPPAAAMYHAEQDALRDVERIAEEVLNR